MPETIEAIIRDGRLHPTVIRFASGSERAGELVLRFDPSLPDVTAPGSGHDPTATFSIAVDEHAGLVTGHVMPRAMGFDLVPDAPSWAASRAFHVELDRRGAHWTLTAAPYQGSVSP